MALSSWADEKCGRSAARSAEFAQWPVVGHEIGANGVARGDDMPRARGDDARARGVCVSRLANSHIWARAALGTCCSRSGLRAKGEVVCGLGVIRALRAGRHLGGRPARKAARAIRGGGRRCVRRCSVCRSCARRVVGGGCTLDLRMRALRLAREALASTSFRVGSTIRLRGGGLALAFGPVFAPALDLVWACCST